MLNSVSKEIQAHLKYYTEFEEIELEVDKWDNQIVRNSYEKILAEKDCLVIIGLLHKI